jgi:iron complex outermembrane receptor protein
MKYFWMFFIIFCPFIFGPLSLSAQEKEVTLETIVVTATRDVQEIRRVPANVTVLTREQIEQSNAKTTIELIRNEMGVMVKDWTGSGKTVTVDIRGFGETGPLNTLVLVDGRRVNEIDLSGVDWTQIPLNQIERIEILRGPASVLYGDNAAGGVIHIITKKPEKPLSVKGEIVRGSYLYHKESGSASGKWGPFSALVSGDYSSTEGYRENGFLRYKDIGGKILLDLSSLIELSLSGNLHRDDYGMPGALPQSLYKEDRRATLSPEDKAETEDGFFALGSKVNLKEMGRIETDLSYRHREVGSLFRSFFYEDKKNLTTWGFTPKYILEKRIGEHPNKLTLGVDYYHSDSKVDSESSFFGSDRIEVKKKSIGLYLYDEFTVLENLLLSLGGRWEWATYEVSQASSGADDRKRESEPAWHVGLTYLFGKGSSLFLNIKRSFRFPVSDELIQYFPTFQINSSIRPQTGYHYETGIRHPFTEWMEGNVTLFWMDLRNELFYNPMTYSNENYPKTRRQGVEMGLRIKPFPWLNFYGNYCYLRPILREGTFSGNEIPGVSRHKGSIGAEIHLGHGFLFNTRTTIAGSQRFISDWGNQVERLDGYYSLDANLSFNHKGLKAFIGVNNLTNRKYVEYGVLYGGFPYYYPSPERNFIAGVSYTF